MVLFGRWLRRGPGNGSHSSVLDAPWRVLHKHPTSRASRRWTAMARFTARLPPRRFEPALDRGSSATASEAVNRCLMDNQVQILLVLDKTDLQSEKLAGRGGEEWHPQECPYGSDGSLLAQGRSRSVCCALPQSREARERTRPHRGAL